MFVPFGRPDRKAVCLEYYMRRLDLSAIGVKYTRKTELIKTADSRQ
jgi:hypothetical protein